MQIQSGKLYENRTWKYLYPCLKFYGKDLINQLNKVFKVAVGVDDRNFKNKSIGNIYILIDTELKSTKISNRYYQENFDNFLTWISYKKYYVTDYVFSKTKHMIVLKIPRKHVLAVKNFIAGKYSKMYSLVDIRRYFKYANLENSDLEIKVNKNLKEVRSVLNKDNAYLDTFIKKVNKDFNTNISKRNFLKAELDYPPIKKEEIFNYTEILNESKEQVL